MKTRKIHDVFQCNMFKPFVPDNYGRYDQPQPPVNIQGGEEESVLVLSIYSPNQWLLNAFTESKILEVCGILHRRENKTLRHEQFRSHVDRRSSKTSLDLIKWPSCLISSFKCSG